VPQLLILGVVIGSAIVASGKKYPVISAFIQETDDLSIRITEGVSKMAPYFMCVLIIYEIIGHTTNALKYIWMPVLVFVIVTVVLMTIFTIITARIEKVNALTLVRALKGPFIKTLSNGSADTVLDYTLKSCRRLLGIDPGYAEVGLSIGLVMYMPISAVGTLIFVIYSASMYGVSATFMWYVIAVVIAVAMCIAVPPVPGVGILTYVVMFAQLGIPKKALIAAMVFDVLTTVLMSAANQYMMQLELILSADRMAMLDHEVLRKLSLTKEKSY
jgi:proton glutamate symport protein